LCEVVVVGSGPAMVMAAPREGAWVRCCPCRVRADGRHLYERWLGAYPRARPRRVAGARCGAVRRLRHRGRDTVVDFLKVLERVRASVEEVHDKTRLFKRLEAGGVRVFVGVGAARFAGENSVTLGDGRCLEAEEFILCAGGYVRRLDLPGGELTLSHSDVWTMGELTRSFAAVGTAPTGC
jgi:pyruvate/2-oxoglutarate dehydrogenase complex dihydrolipoamide dehydrogenase (E3) component